MHTSRPIAAFLVMAIGTLAAIPFRRGSAPEPLSHPFTPTAAAQIDLSTPPPLPDSRWSFEKIAPAETTSPAELPPASQDDLVPVVQQGSSVSSKENTAPDEKLSTVTYPAAFTSENRTSPPDLPRRFEFPLASLKTSGSDLTNTLGPFASSPSLQSAYTTHQIRKGDTLEKIATDYLGTSQRAEEIYELNKHLLASPDLLPLGKILKVPAIDREELLKALTGPEIPAPTAPPSVNIQEPAVQEIRDELAPVPVKPSSMPLTEL